MLAARAVVCLISSRKMAASSKSSSSMALVKLLLQVLEPVGQIAALAQGFGHFAHVPRAFVHRLEQALQRLGEGLVTFRAAQPARLLEIRLGEAAGGALQARPAAGLFDFLRRAQPEQQVRQRKPGGVVHPLGLGAFLAQVHLLHFVPGDWVRWTVASFSLQMQHNINSLLVYRLAGRFSQGVVLRHQFLGHRPRLAGRR